MMMIIAPNSLAHQKKGAQREGDEEAGDQRKGGQIGTQTSGADAPTGLSRLGVLDARNSRKHGLGQWYEFPLHRKGRGQNNARQIRSNTMEKPRLKRFVSCL